VNKTLTAPLNQVIILAFPSPSRVHFWQSGLYINANPQVIVGKALGTYVILNLTRYKDFGCVYIVNTFVER